MLVSSGQHIFHLFHPEPFFGHIFHNLFRRLLWLQTFFHIYSRPPPPPLYLELSLSEEYTPDSDNSTKLLSGAFSCLLTDKDWLSTLSISHDSIMGLL